MDTSQGLRRQPQRFIEAIAARGRSMLTLIRGADADHAGPKLRDIGDLAEDLLSFRGETAGHKIATSLFAQYRALSEDEKLGFLNMVADGYGPDQAALERAIHAFRSAPGEPTIASLRAATVSPRQVLIRRLNLAENGTLELIKLREDALRFQKQIGNFDVLDADFSHVLTPWFNIGFLDLRLMEWSSAANVLHKVITYEAVHEIQGWEDLRRRVEPDDRRCYAFFHPRMPDEPLIFVEVALTKEIPRTIATLLDEKRVPIAAADASLAVFYSISNCQVGLRGIPFGSMLIKRVVELLSKQLPMLKTFVTLSPVPGFAAWLARQRQDESSVVPDEALKALGGIGPQWSCDTASQDERQALVIAAAHYFLKARTPQGKVINSVARFHLGNGARLEQINFAADLSANGLKDAHGLMVNYLYDQKTIDTNAQHFSEGATVAASGVVRRIIET